MTPPSLRIAHLADTHIGMENYGKVNSATGLNSRLDDFLRSLDQALDAALAANVDLVVFAGDVYKTRDPTPTHQREFARRIRRVTAAGVPVFISAGNHDIPLSVGRATSVDIFRALEVPDVTVARSLGAHCLQTRSGPVQVLAFPWTLRSMLAALPEYKNRTIAEMNQAVVDLNRERLRELAGGLDPHVPTLVVGHAHLFGARVGAERLLTMGSDPMYDLTTFDVPGVDYVAMGHIHKHQAMGWSPPPIVYSGSIDRVDFGEEHEDKGWVLVEIPEKGRADWEFKRVDARRFLTIDAKVQGENATEDVVKAIARQADRLADAVVKLRIELPAERLGELRDDDIRAQLRGAFYVAPIERIVQQRARDRWGTASTSIQHAPPLEALTFYLESQKVDPERRELLLRYARALMDEDHAHAEPDGRSPLPEGEGNSAPSTRLSPHSSSLRHSFGRDPGPPVTVHRLRLLRPETRDLGPRP